MIEQKRKSLELFIREQTLGPGAIGKRFVDLVEQPNFPNIKHQFSNEMLNVVPGGIYSTGILFPVDDTKRELRADRDNDTRSDGPLSRENAEIEEQENENDEEATASHESLNQMYPNIMGMTVCLHPKILEENDLNITISGRYYAKINVKDEDKRLAVLLEQDKDVFRGLVQKLPIGDPITTSIKIQSDDAGNNYISFNGNKTDLKPIKARIYELKRQYCETLKTGEKGNHKSLDTLKESLFDELRKKLIPTSIEGKEILEKLKKIEQIENFCEHILDLTNIYDSNGYGLWKCETFERQVGSCLSDTLQTKHIYTYRNRKELSDIYKAKYEKDKWASLSVNLQYNRQANSTIEKIFMKVQIVNTSSHFTHEDTKNGRNFFSLASEEVNKRCFFGVGIRVSSKYLLPYRDISLKGHDQFGEEDINRFIYRQYKNYGIGHGCSIKWSCKDGLIKVSTEYIPTCETPDIDPTPRHKGFFEKDTKNGYFTPKPIFENTPFFRFKWLSTLSCTSDEEVIAGLLEFVEAYSQWINNQQDTSNKNIVRQIKANCKRDESRIRRNIVHLSTNKQHLKRFRLMNTAMFIQLWHSTMKENVVEFMNVEDFEGFFEPFYQTHADDRLFSKSDHAAWRPFQLAFILLNIDGIFQLKEDTKWRARNEWVDLVWFPTGGGKTEAYLGLIALTILHRRIQYGAEGGGTAVIMRYTLRLLTAQQFHRATYLIMALELMRRWETHELGKEPIFIGLYVGQGSLPNKLRGDQESLLSEYQKLKTAQQKKIQTRTKIQLKNCPCCGQPLDPITYADATYPEDTYNFNRILLSCSDAKRKCAFAFSYAYPFDLSRKDQGPIPVSMCDEEIYQHPPALLFGTVDKFAQIAHKISNKEDKRNADSRRLFGKGNWEDGKPRAGYLPPDMIIQDELHLMMGPLGSAVALFESAVDQLCSRQENEILIRPKIISSTATTRNTDLQIMALFNRKVNLFPKPGINCDDSFFAFYKRQAATPEGEDNFYISKRKYVGILPTGRTQMWMQLRLAAILFTHRAIFEAQQIDLNHSADSILYNDTLTKTLDYYHTVLTYFNSLREVGKTESQIFTYLVKETRRVFNKVLRPDKLMHCFYTYASCFNTGELTGRLSGEDVIEQMAKIGSAWSSTNRLAHGDEKHPEKGRTPPDFVIATNMISVGIDISRFNIMIINCMPRNIAEYIQASSRVAREKEGLVITVHHPFRSRDISHYEKFIEFHEKMYSYVEPISITPFTRKALERYLPLYIATMLRHSFQNYAEREGANVTLSEDEKHKLSESLFNYFRDRKQIMHKDLSINESTKEILVEANLKDIQELIKQNIHDWQTEKARASEAGFDLYFNNAAISTKTARPQKQLYVNINEYSDNIHSELWRIPQSLRVVDPEAVIHVEPK